MIGRKLDNNADGVFEYHEWFAYDGDQIALAFEDLDGDGSGPSSLANRYFNGPQVDQVYADEQFNSNGALNDLLYPLADQVGSVRDLVRWQSGFATLANHLRYDSSGQIISQSDGSVQHRYNFTGRIWDPYAQLYNYRARWYDPALGRFVSDDPIGFAAGDTNLQRYVGNDPANYIDPSGLTVAEPWNDGRSTYNQRFVQTTDIADELNRFDPVEHRRFWPVHHTYQQHEPIARWLHEESKGKIKVHDVENLRAVPNYIHDEITGRQNDWWRKKIASTPRAKSIEDVIKKKGVTLAEYQKLVDEIECKYKKYWLSPNAKQKHLDKLLDALNVKTATGLFGKAGRKAFDANKLARDAHFANKLGIGPAALEALTKRRFFKKRNRGKECGNRSQQSPGCSRLLGSRSGGRNESAFVAVL